MGYRHHLYIVPRQLVSDIQNLTREELADYAKAHDVRVDEDDQHFSLIDMLGKNEFYNFGKYYENAANMYKIASCPLFLNPETHRFYADYSPYVIEKEGVLCAIDHYRQKVIDWYKGLLQAQEEYEASHEPWVRSRLPQEQRIRNHLESQLNEWQNDFGCLPYNLREDSSTIVSSWLYEYAAFELVHQLKIMDWENNTLVFMGW